MTPRDMELEAALYWRRAQNLAALRLSRAVLEQNRALAKEVRSDLEAMAMHSEWPRLRRAALGALNGGRRRAAG
jgi:hypothetical protein